VNLPPGREGEERDRAWMELALAEAEEAAREGEVPVGCLIVKGDRLLARAHNATERLGDPTAHAEMQAIRAATALLGESRLRECELFVTLEPCFMCAGALVLARLDRVVYGARDPKFGGCGSLWDIPSDRRVNHRVRLRGGVLAERAAKMLKAFFQGRR